jgi:hypothetical protein
MGQRLKNWKVKHKLLKTIRHFLQMSIFMLTSYFEVKKIKDHKVILNHNLESLVGDVYVLHNVFNYENLNKKLIKN